MNIHIPSKFINWPNISIITFLLINLVFGFVTVGNRGLSWDEPLFYNYADNIGYAYSISARLDGTFDLNKAYGIDPEEHMQYGPAYLLISEPITKVIERILTLDEAEAWHITNFLTFLPSTSVLNGSFMFLNSLRVFSILFCVSLSIRANSKICFIEFL